MKGKWALGSLAGILLIAAVTMLLLYEPEGFTGSRTAEAASYCLNIRRMTGTDRYTMELAAGDALQVRFETVEGSLRMEITEPDGTVLYTGNGEGAEKFTVHISESGVHTIAVEAHRAKGMIRIQRKTDT